MNEPDDTRSLDDALRNKLDAYRPTPSDAVWAAIETRVGAGGAPPPPPPGRGAYWPMLLTGILGVALGWWLPHPSHDAARKPQNETPVVQTALAPTAGAAATAGIPASALVLASASASAAPDATTAMAAPVATTSSDKPTSSYKARKAPRAPKTGTPDAAADAPSLSQYVTPPPALPLILLPLLAAETAVQAAPADSAAAARTARRLALTAEKRALAHLQRRADSLLALLSVGAEATVLAAAPPAAAEPEAAPRAILVRRAPTLTHRWRLTATLAPEHATLAATIGPETARFGARSALSAALAAGYLLTESLTLSAGVGYGQVGAAKGGQPTAAYHFLTVPVAVQYRLTPISRSTRCWADVGAGAQVQTQVGRPAHGPRFGGGAVAFMAGLGLNVALAPRLVVRIAPTARWQPRRLTATGVAMGMSLIL